LKVSRLERPQRVHDPRRDIWFEDLGPCVVEMSYEGGRSPTQGSAEPENQVEGALLAGARLTKANTRHTREKRVVSTTKCSMIPDCVCPRSPRDPTSSSSSSSSESPEGARRPGPAAKHPSGVTVETRRRLSRPQGRAARHHPTQKKLGGSWGAQPAHSNSTNSNSNSNSRRAWWWCVVQQRKSSIPPNGQKFGVWVFREISLCLEPGGLQAPGHPGALRVPEPGAFRHLGLRHLEGTWAPGTCEPRCPGGPSLRCLGGACEPRRPPGAWTPGACRRLVT
jgi:hypothetical protein